VKVKVGQEPTKPTSKPSLCNPMDLLIGNSQLIQSAKSCSRQESFSSSCRLAGGMMSHIEPTATPSTGCHTQDILNCLIYSPSIRILPQLAVA